MKTKLLASTVLLLVLCLSCGKDTPLEPEIYKPPEMLPLAAGAKWEYSVYYYHFSKATSAGPCITDKEYGRLELEVLRESAENGAKAYELKVNFKLDSLSFDYSPVCGYFYPGDTTYTRYNPLDTTFYQTIVFANDTLWYKASDSLYMLMPDSGIAGSTVNLELFNAAGRYAEFFHWISSHSSSTSDQQSYRREWSIPWGAEISKATVRPADGGIFQLDWLAQKGGGYFLHIYRWDLQYKLQKYTPGKTGD